MMECERFPEGSRMREICEGMADLPLAKINRYREKWGLDPLEAKPEGAAPVVPRKVARPPNPTRPPARQRVLLGDRVERVLSRVGVTKERVSKWLGRPCGCAERKRKLNELHLWAERKLGGLVNNTQATEQLEKMLE